MGDVNREIKSTSFVCALPSCGKEFVPNREWQKCCCEDHARKLRWKRRQERVRAALAATEKAL